MTALSFKVLLDPKALQDLGGNSYKLCMSNTVNESNNVASVTLAPGSYSTTNSFGWVVTYFASASKKPWESGGIKVGVSSAIQETDLGQGYRLPNWNTHPEIFNQDVENALKFNPIEVDAAPVVYLAQLTTRDGRSKQHFADPIPIYIAPSMTLSGNTVTLTPKKRARIFFQQNIETSGMISESDAYLPVDIDLTDRPTGQTLTLSADRKWSKT